MSLEANRKEVFLNLFSEDLWLKNKHKKQHIKKQNKDKQKQRIRSHFNLRLKGIFATDVHLSVHFRAFKGTTLLCKM